MPKPDEREPIFGFDDSPDLALETLSLNISEFTEGAAADFRGTIVGLKVIKGGDERINNAGETFITQDQLLIQWRVDNLDEVDLEDPMVQQYVNVPKTVERDGHVYRAKPVKTSVWALFASSLAECGVSEDQAFASVYQIAGPRDLLGLQARRQIKTFKGYNDRDQRVGLITAVYGWDNEIRKKAGLKPIEVK